jgi:hypothetical protein
MVQNASSTNESREGGLVLFYLSSPTTCRTFTCNQLVLGRQGCRSFWETRTVQLMALSPFFQYLLMTTNDVHQLGTVAKFAGNKKVKSLFDHAEKLVVLHQIFLPARGMVTFLVEPVCFQHSSFHLQSESWSQKCSLALEKSCADFYLLLHKELVWRTFSL